MCSDEHTEPLIRVRGLRKCNIRTSTVLGFVGAGGLGQQLAISLRLFRYDELSTLVVAVLVLMLIIDALSRRARRGLGAVTHVCV